MDDADNFEARGVDDCDDDSIIEITNPDGTKVANPARMLTERLGEYLPRPQPPFVLSSFCKLYFNR